MQPEDIESRSGATVPLSICIPTYNRANTLRDLIESVYHDGHLDIEVVVSDNASTDHTEAVVAALQVRFPRLRYHRNATNLGIDRNFLQAMSLAQGRHAILTGSDDGFPPGAMTRILALCASDPDLVIFNRIECDRQLNPVRYRPYMDARRGEQRFNIRDENGIIDYFDAYDSIAGAGAFISSDLVKVARWKTVTCPPELIGKLYPHLAMLFQIMKEGADVVYCPEYLVLCRLGNDSFSDLNVLQRMAVDLDGFAALAAVVFADMPRAGAALGRLLVRDHTQWGMGNPLTFLSYRLRTSDPDWATLLARFTNLGTLGVRFRLYNALTPSWLISKPVRQLLLRIRTILKP